jgi:integrase
MMVTQAWQGGKVMARVKFSGARISAFACDPGKGQTFYWDTEQPGLGLRVTAKGAKSFIFQAKKGRDTIRVTIGDVRNWPLDALRDRAGEPTGPGAREEANRLQHIIMAGRDPRVVKADNLAAEDARREAAEAARAAESARQQRESVTLCDAWAEYVADRSPLWSDLHRRDHERAIQAGGEARKRSKKLTEPGPLASLAKVRLADLTSERIEQWAKIEAAIRPTSARLAFRLVKAFLNWCTAHREYKQIVGSSAAASKRARESLGRSRTKSDVLQREQLPAWFAAVKQLDSPVVRAYLQVLLLAGPRREELAALRWDDVNFQWNHLTLNDKVEEFRMVPLTPYVAHLLADLKRRNESPPTVRAMKRMQKAGETWQPSPWVFASGRAESGRLTDPSNAHRRACAAAGLAVTLHGLRRSFATLSEWVETPAGIAAQIQGHAPQGVREQNYIRRPLDLLRMWHVKIEAWMLEQAGIEFVPISQGLSVVRKEQTI